MGSLPRLAALIVITLNVPSGLQDHRQHVFYRGGAAVANTAEDLQFSQLFFLRVVPENSSAVNNQERLPLQVASKAAKVNG